MMNQNHRGDEICSACGFTTGHAGYGEDSIGYVDGTIGPLCDKCNERLREEVLIDSAEIERLTAALALSEEFNAQKDWEIERLRMRIRWYCTHD